MGRAPWRSWSARNGSTPHRRSISASSLAAAVHLPVVMTHTSKVTQNADELRPRRWERTDLALVELARMQREIVGFRATARDASDHAHLESLEACRAALFRLVARELGLADDAS